MKGKDNDLKHSRWNWNGNIKKDWKFNFNV